MPEIKIGRLKIRGQIQKPQSAGLTLVEVLVLVAIVGLLLCPATIGISHPPYMHKSPAQKCAMNIEAIEGAKQMWMEEAKKSENDTATEAELNPFMKGDVFPTCPNGGTYTINANKLRATCSVHTVTNTTMQSAAP